MIRNLVAATITILLSIASLRASESGPREFYASLAECYCISEDSVVCLAELGIADQDLAVVFEVAAVAGVDGNAIAMKRLDGESWINIAADYGLGPADFYFPVSGPVESSYYLPIYAKYRVIPKAQWDLISLSDNDICALVNLKFITEEFAYSPYQVMAMTEYGKSYAEICRQLWIAEENLGRMEFAAKKP